MMKGGLQLVEWWLDRLLDLRVAAVSFLVLLLWTRFTWERIVRRHQKDIPEPPALPVVGHLHLLGKLPHQSLMRLARQHGPLMSLRLGSLRVLVASNAEMAKEFLKTHDAVWASRPPTSFGEFFFYNYNNVISQPLNDLWRKLRKVYMSEFLSTANIERQKDQRHESVMCLVNALLAPGQENVDIYAAVTKMNSFQMTKLIFGKRFSLDYSAFTSAGGRKNLAELIVELSTIDHVSLGKCFPWLKLFDLNGLERKVKRIHHEFDSYLSELLHERGRQLLDSEEPDDSKDLARSLLSMLNKEDGSGLTSENIKGAIADMYVAGIETTSTLVTFAVAEVIKHPDVKQKLLDELDRVVGHDRLVDESHLVNLKYLKTVLNESLRLHPPLPLLLSRCSTAPTVVAGYYIPAGTQLVINAYAIQRDPESWENPLAFQRERFADSSVNARGQYFQLVPLGSGRRECPGLNMGLTISELVVAQLFHTLDISLPPGMKPEDLDITEVSGVTTGLATPLRVVVSPRLPRNLYSN